MLCSSASFFAASLILLIYNVKLLKFERIKFKNSINRIKKWMVFGIPVSAWASIGLLLPFLDRYFISIYFNFTGQYSH